MRSQYALAVDLGGSNVRVALVSREGKILQKTSEPTSKQGKTGTAITSQIVRLTGKITKEVPTNYLKGIGIASAGPLDYKRGGPIHSPNIPYSFVPLVKPLQEKFSLPVQLFNDTNAAVLGEKHFGAGKNIQNLVYITLSTGIGGGAIVNDTLLLGKSGNAAEIGHITVDTTYNLMCGCKKGIGHWESLASGANIPKFFRAWSKKNNKPLNPAPDTKEIFQRGRKDDKIAIEFLDELARVNARAISTLIVAYDPALITIGGSVALNNPKFTLEGILKYVDHYLKVPKIAITELGDDISLLGAVAATLGHTRK